jgi:outer membrane biosynthesis protein TonB
MIRRLALAALLATATIPCLAADDDPVDLTEFESRGRLTRIVRPDYPAEAVARGQAGVVEIEGPVDVTGALTNPTYRPDKPESEIFVTALKKVVPSWSFVNPLDKECQPSAKPVKVEVSFEIDNGTPRIFVTHNASPLRGKPPDPHFKRLSGPSPDFPTNMWKLGIPGDVYTKVFVDRTGRVVDVRSRTYTPRTAIDVSSFTEAVDEAVRQWQFPAVPPGAKAPWAGCYRFQFRFKRR